MVLTAERDALGGCPLGRPRILAGFWNEEVLRRIRILGEEKSGGELRCREWWERGRALLFLGGGFWIVRFSGIGMILPLALGGEETVRAQTGRRSSSRTDDSPKPDWTTSPPIRHTHSLALFSFFAGRSLPVACYPPALIRGRQVPPPLR